MIPITICPYIKDCHASHGYGFVGKAKIVAIRITHRFYCYNTSGLFHCTIRQARDAGYTKIPYNICPNSKTFPKEIKGGDYYDVRNPYR